MSLVLARTTGVLIREPSASDVVFPDSVVGRLASIKGIGMFSILGTIDRGICIGCGACAVASGDQDIIYIDENGMYAADAAKFSRDGLARADGVCPFSDKALSEDEISAKAHDGHLVRHEFLGRFTETYVGRVGDDDYLDGSSSGGMTSWVLAELLEQGKIDAVLNVGRAEPDTDLLFDYQRSDQEGVIRSRKSDYYSVTLDDALATVLREDKRFALVGVPCFIKAARLLAEQDPVLKERLVFYAGLVGGHMKSHFFGESLAWQLGVRPEDLGQVDFRVKNPNRPVSAYDFGALQKGDSEWRYRQTGSLVGGNWGHAAFQPEACNFCDDIFAETADVAFGDAWLPEFRDEWRGTNVVVSRNSEIDELIAEGIDGGVLNVRTADPEEVAKSQAGNFRHRRLGVSVRLADDIEKGLKVPRKRVEPSVEVVDSQRLEVIRQRRTLSRLSFAAYRKAWASGDLSVYLDAMLSGIRNYDRIQNHLWKRVARQAKRVVKKILGR